MNQNRSRVQAVHWGAFDDHLLVDCPACGGKAVIAIVQSPEPRTRIARLVCEDCGLAREEAAAQSGVTSNPFEACALRLRAETRHGDLVAWNEDHLDYLERYLSGVLREETPAADGIRNRSLVSRLPAWAKAAKNRDEVLKAIARVRRDKL